MNDPHYKEAVVTLLISIIALTILGIIINLQQKPSYRYNIRLLDHIGGSKTPLHL